MSSELVSLGARSLVASAALLATLVAGCAQAGGSGLRTTKHTDAGSSDDSSGSTTAPGDDSGGTTPGADGSTTTTPPTDSGGTTPVGDSSTTTTTPPDSATTTTPPPPDAACTVPSGKVCALFPQCGCPSGQNCDVSAADGTTACIASGVTPLNGKCKAESDCPVGASCVGTLCRAFCNTASDCAGGGNCKSVTSGGTTPTPIPGDQVCFTSCDPRSPSAACGAGTGCSFLDASTTACVAAGTATGAAGCTSTDPSGCAPGYVCLSDLSCKKWCRLSAGSADCGGGMTCSGFTTTYTYGGESYGVCN